MSTISSIITFKEGEKYISNYEFYKRGEFTPIYMIKDNKEYFVRNLVKPIGYKDAYDDYIYQRSLDEIEKIKSELINNNGMYYRQYGKFKNPFDFVNWVKENNYTFEIHEELFREGNNFTDFHGNLKECSSAFSYRIYDKMILQNLKNEVSKCKQYALFLREEGRTIE